MADGDVDLDKVNDRFRELKRVMDVIEVVENTAWVKSAAAVLIGGFATAAIILKSDRLKLTAALLGLVLPLVHLVALFLLKRRAARRLNAALPSRRRQRGQT